jgi:hypothetical protein
MSKLAETLKKSIAKHNKAIQASKKAAERLAGLQKK